MDRALELLKQASTATISTQLLARGLRNTFLQGVKPLTGHRMAGPAFTLRYIPAREDIDTLDVESPIGCAEVPVYPGDIMVGDAEGVVCVPRQLAEEVAEAAAEQDRLEHWIQCEIASGKPLRGTYPPDENTRRRYHDTRSSG